jgi:hypothetical protein
MPYLLEEPHSLPKNIQSGKKHMNPRSSRKVFGCINEFHKVTFESNYAGWL